MAVQIRMAPEEIAQRGEAWYEKLTAKVEPGNVGRYLIVEVETGDYDMGDDYILPTERLREKTPGAQLYALRVGYRSIGCIGGRFTPARR